MIAGYQYIKAQREHGAVARKILLSVLQEFGLLDVYEHDKLDLDNIDRAYQGGYFGMILNKEKEFVGTFGLYKKTNDTAEIRKMYLLPEARGKGLGKHMLQILLDKARQLGFQKVELETAGVFTRAMSLYRSMGFVQGDTTELSPACNRYFYLHLQ